MAMENGNVRLVTKRKSGLADGGNDGIQDGERGVAGVAACPLGDDWEIPGLLWQLISMKKDIHSKPKLVALKQTFREYPSAPNIYSSTGVKEQNTSLSTMCLAFGRR